MNKAEKAKLIELYEQTLRTNRDASRDTGLRYPNPTYQINKGYEWGIKQAMRKLGFDEVDLYVIWERVTFDTKEASCEEGK